MNPMNLESIQHQVQDLQKQALEKINQAKNLVELDQARTQFLGKKGQLTDLLKQIGLLPADQRSAVGQWVNIAKQQLLTSVEELQEFFKHSKLQSQLESEWLDVTLPGRASCGMGSLHPVTRIRERLEQLFLSEGFIVVEGPEIEDDFHNFEALNFPSIILRALCMILFILIMACCYVLILPQFKFELCKVQALPCESSPRVECIDMNLILHIPPCSIKLKVWS